MRQEDQFCWELVQRESHKYVVNRNLLTGPKQRWDWNTAEAVPSLWEKVGTCSVKAGLCPTSLGHGRQPCSDSTCSLSCLIHSPNTKEWESSRIRHRCFSFPVLTGGGVFAPWVGPTLGAVWILLLMGMPPKHWGWLEGQLWQLSTQPPTSTWSRSYSQQQAHWSWCDEGLQNKAVNEDNLTAWIDGPACLHFMWILTPEEMQSQYPWCLIKKRPKLQDSDPDLNAGGCWDLEGGWGSSLPECK